MRVTSKVLLLCALAFSSQGGATSLPSPGESRSEFSNSVIFQYFHWYLPNDGRLWTQLTQEAPELARKGFTALWLPPASKAAGGSQDVGYGVYDLYDLGEFDQKGSRRTKYGTKNEYLAAIQRAQGVGLDVYADIVINHRIGADRTERTEAVEVNPRQRQEVISSPFSIEAWTKFEFTPRARQYSDFVWHWYHFNGVDWDQNRRENGKIYRFTGNGKAWDPDVSKENGNYDFLLGADVDFEHPEVQSEIKRWGEWFTELSGIDGYRLDAVKHISASYTREWLEAMRNSQGRPLFAIAEYLDYDVDKLLNYLQTQTPAGQQLSLFDMPLHLNFFRAGEANGDFPMNQLLANTLLQRKPSNAISFVESHDTQPLQALESPVADWFKPLAYAVILLREEGYPSVFYADYYGARYRDRREGQEREGSIQSQKTAIDQLLSVRHTYAYGKQHSYFDDSDIIGWTREGNSQFPKGLAVLMSDRNAGKKRMFVGSQHAGSCFRDITGRHSACVKIDSTGFGEFLTLGRNFSLWVGDSLTQEK